MKNFRSNIILIAGSGRNLGKTLLGCELIKKVKALNPIAIKISPHLHKTSSGNHYFVGKENDIESGKDSSRYLKAGANPSIYIESTDKNLPVAWEEAEQSLPTNVPVIIESGGLVHILKPSLLLFLCHTQDEALSEKKMKIKELADWTVSKRENNLEEVVNQLSFIDNQWVRV